jgi:hypothetical protein
MGYWLWTLLVDHRSLKLSRELVGRGPQMDLYRRFANSQ